MQDCHFFDKNMLFQKEFKTDSGEEKTKEKSPFVIPEK
jgi:hypothetical protein